MVSTGTSVRMKATAILLRAAAHLSSPPISAGAPSSADLPVVVPAQSWRPLLASSDASLQAALEAALERHPLWASLVSQEKMAVGVADVARPEAPRFARVNGNSMMYAASLPKIAILLAAFQGLEDGSLEDVPEVQRDLGDMIRVSCNASATRMIDRLGYRKIETVLTDPAYRLFDPALGGGLWVGKRYAKQGERYPDPLKGISHAATVTQVSRFYYLLATGRLINPERSRQMLDKLSGPGIEHKFVRTLKRLAPEARLYRKSGSWRNWHSDSVLVWGEAWRRYILVALVEHPDGGRVLEELVPSIEAILQPARLARAGSNSSIPSQIR